MSELDPRVDQELDPELRALLTGLDEPRASADFRARLKQRFLAGEAAPAPAPLRALPPLHGAPRPATRSRLASWGVAIALVAAAVLLFTFLRGGEEPASLGRPPAWSVAALGGPVEVDGATFAPDDAQALEAALARGHRLRVAQGWLVLRSGDWLLLEAGAGTELDLDVVHDAVAKGAVPAFALATERGSLAVVTGPAFGDGLELETPDLELAIQGTAFAVDVEPKGTCVCGAEGAVQVRARAADCEHVVKKGGMAFESAAGNPCVVGDAMAKHLEPLNALLERAVALWGPR